MNKFSFAFDICCICNLMRVKVYWEALGEGKDQVMLWNPLVELSFGAVAIQRITQHPKYSHIIIVVGADRLHQQYTYLTMNLHKLFAI